MTSKILVADDSLTIQKVIGITLASSGYELVECLNDVDLFRFLQSKEFDLVLLDFNLSEKQTGYELSRQIKELRPDISIMIMLGTFDSVDESLLSECGVFERVVKPFESGKFIKKCKDLIENKSVTHIPQSIHKIEDTFSADDKIDSWIVDAPAVHKEVSTEHEMLKSPLQLDPLKSEIEGWSVDSATNLEDKYNKIFPDVIESKPEPKALERLHQSSQFISEEEESKVNISTKHEDSTEPMFEIPLDLNQQLISEINDDFTPDSFWAIDDVVSIELEDTKEIKETHLDEVFAKNTKHEIPTAAVKESVVNIDEVVAKLAVSIRPLIEDLVKEYCRQSAEKVAWEVIPDLAENLIRKELKEISDSLQ